jgi:hypothetical protein
LRVADHMSRTCYWARQPVNTNRNLALRNRSTGSMRIFKTLDLE